jgi:hypothetical protein
MRVSVVEVVASLPLATLLSTRPAEATLAAAPLGSQRVTSERHLGPAYLVSVGFPIWASAQEYEQYTLNDRVRSWHTSLGIQFCYEGSRTRRLDHMLTLSLSLQLERLETRY